MDTAVIFFVEGYTYTWLHMAPSHRYVVVGFSPSRIDNCFRDWSLATQAHNTIGAY